MTVLASRELVPAVSPRQRQIARLESYLSDARDAIAGAGPGQLGLFRRPLVDCTSAAAREWLDSILLPAEPKELYFRVRVLSDESGRREGVWLGFGWQFGGCHLRISDDVHGACSLHIAPGNVRALEVLEVIWHTDDEDGGCW